MPWTDVVWWWLYVSWCACAPFVCCDINTLAPLYGCVGVCVYVCVIYTLPPPPSPLLPALQPESDDDDRRLWRFRCDTVDEMQTWMEAFAVAVKM